jgi:hypothetical protein
MTAPERIWAKKVATGFRGAIGTWNVCEFDDDERSEYVRADLVEAAVKRALYLTRDRTWSGVEAIIADPEAIRRIMEGKE